MVITQIIQDARLQQKGILIFGSPRSRTHALGDMLANKSNFENFGEICRVGYVENFWDDIDLLISKNPTIGQIVQLSAKIELARNTPKLKDNFLIVNIIRKDKVKQFSSWFYSRILDPTALYGWHNYKKDETKVGRGTQVANKEHIDQFKLEQIVDSYFLPDYTLYYEDTNFDSANYQKNEYAFPVEEIFKNIDYIRLELENWKYVSRENLNAK